MPHPTNHPFLEIAESASVHPLALIEPSERGTWMKIGAGSRIYAFAVLKAIGGSGDLLIGEHCHINSHAVLYSGNGIRLGNMVLIAPGCVLAPSNHAFANADVPMLHQGFMPSKGGIVIEDDVWLGANCVVLDGVTIGKGSIIAAGSVVTKSVPPNEIWGGVPAAFLRKRGQKESAP